MRRTRSRSRQTPRTTGISTSPPRTRERARHRTRVRAAAPRARQILSRGMAADRHRQSRLAAHRAENGRAQHACDRRVAVHEYLRTFVVSLHSGSGEPRDGAGSRGAPAREVSARSQRLLGVERPHDRGARYIPRAQWDSLARRGYHRHAWFVAAEACGAEPRHVGIFAAASSSPSSPRTSSARRCTATCTRAGTARRTASRPRSARGSVLRSRSARR